MNRIFDKCGSVCKFSCHQQFEQIHVGKEYGDIRRGVFIVRGENVGLLGDIVIIISLVQ